MADARLRSTESLHAAPASDARERLSAWIDGELDVAAGAGCLDDACGDPQVQADWAAWHCVGDALRSAEVGALHSDAFRERLALALRSEPALLAPAAAADLRARRFLLRRLVLPGTAVAAAGAVIAFLALPQLRGAGGDAELASAPGAPPAATVASVSVTAPQPSAAVEVVRLPQLEAYLAAHREVGAPSAVLPRSTTYLRTSVEAVERR